MFLPLQYYHYKCLALLNQFVNSLPQITAAVCYAVHSSITTKKITSSPVDLEPLYEDLTTVIHTYVIFTLTITVLSRKKLYAL